MQTKHIIGVTELVSFGKSSVKVPAKIDTGADRSAIWASKIHVNRDGVLSFVLFDEGSEYYTGKVLKRTKFGVAIVKSSNGTKERRYRTPITVVIRDRKIRATFYLSDRSTQQFPVLIGRRTMRGKFIIDAEQTAVKIKKPVIKNTGFKQNPYEFHKKYIMNKAKGAK